MIWNQTSSIKHDSSQWSSNIQPKPQYAKHIFEWRQTKNMDVLHVDFVPQFVRCLYASNEALVRLLNDTWTPPIPRFLLVGFKRAVSYNFCYFLKLIIHQSCPRHTAISQVCGGEEVCRYQTSSSSLFFFAQCFSIPHNTNIVFAPGVDTPACRYVWITHYMK